MTLIEKIFQIDPNNPECLYCDKIYIQRKSTENYKILICYFCEEKLDVNYDADFRGFTLTCENFVICYCPKLYENNNYFISNLYDVDICTPNLEFFNKKDFLFKLKTYALFS